MFFANLITGAIMEGKPDCPGCNKPMRIALKAKVPSFICEKCSIECYLHEDGKVTNCSWVKPVGG